MLSFLISFNFYVDMAVGIVKKKGNLIWKSTLWTFIEVDPHIFLINRACHSLCVFIVSKNPILSSVFVLLFSMARSIGLLVCAFVLLACSSMASAAIVEHTFHVSFTFSPLFSFHVQNITNVMKNIQIITGFTGLIRCKT